MHTTCFTYPWPSLRHRMTTLVEIPNEILLKILRFCRVVDALKLERCCKRLWGVVSSRPVWLSFFVDFDLTLDGDPFRPIENVSAEELRHFVIRSVKGYYNWTSSSPCMTSAIGLFTQRAWPSLLALPGRKYLLEYSEQESCVCVICWDLHSLGKAAAFTTPYSGSIGLKSFNFDYVSSSIIRVVFCYVNDSHLHIEIIELDIAKKCFESVFSLDHPREDDGLMEVTCSIRGSYAAVSSQSTWVIAVDLLAKKHILIRLGEKVNYGGSAITCDTLIVALNRHKEPRDGRGHMLCAVSLKEIFRAVLLLNAESHPSVRFESFVSDAVDLHNLSGSETVDISYTSILASMSLHGPRGGMVPWHYEGDEEVVESISIVLAYNEVRHGCFGEEKQQTIVTAQQVYLLRRTPGHGISPDPGLWDREFSFYLGKCSAPLIFENSMAGKVCGMSKSGRFVVHNSLGTESRAMTLSSMWTPRPPLCHSDASGFIPSTVYNTDFSSGALVRRTHGKIAMVEYFD
ncbi:hypothetical protein DFH11DRAFT_493769 [Phellopilus nigrolimitatus]|nr:hypothetical protein DFH11DRAFT_493769 [Phellopilus nigrolimitatus]